jgi:hypothetical protein
MNLQQGYDGNFPNRFELNIVAEADEHKGIARYTRQGIYCEARLRCC